MDEYLKKYLTKRGKNGQKKKGQRSMKIYDSENEEAEKNLIKNKDEEKGENADKYNFERLDSSEEEIPITVTDAGAGEVIELSNDKKKLILDSLRKGEQFVSGEIKSNKENSNRHVDSKKNKKWKKNKVCETTDNTKMEKKKNGENIEYRKESETRVISKHKSQQKSKHKLYSDADSHSYSKSESEYRADTKGENETYTDYKYENESESESESDSDMSLPRRTRYAQKEAYSSASESQSDGNGKEERYNKGERTRENRLSASSTSSESATSNNLSETNFIYYAEKDDKHVLAGMNKTVYRDKHGNVISREEWIQEQKKRLQNRNRTKKRMEHEPLEWASGLVQKEIQESVVKENENILKKRKIVNYDFDPEYDEILKNRIREEDPMNIYLKKEENENEKDKKPTCPFQTPYNRFNILAGYRWDGVVRGNGYEQRRYEALKMKQHQDKISYMNSSYGI